MFKRTTAVNKIKKMKARKKVIPGGSSAGKTIAILIILISIAAKYLNIEISVVSESIPHLRKGAVRDFLKIMKETGRYIEANWNRTLLTYTFSNGSYIEFFSVDQESKVRGPRRNILYINECNNIGFETYHQLAIRTSDDIYLDFNPSHPFWVHDELKEAEDAEWLTLTYKDNEALSENIVKEIEQAKEKGKTSTYWENWWKVYGLGQIGNLDGVVFNNWKIIDSLPDKARLEAFGLDFGYSIDPTSGVGFYKIDGKKIFDEFLYQTGLTNPEIANNLKAEGFQKFNYGYADSAEPKSIAEINQRGFTVKAVTKGADSIRYGIEILQQCEPNEPSFYVTSRSVNLIKELRGYVWDTDRSGNKTGKPIDYNNHAIDAMRYVALMKLKPKKSFRLTA